MSAALENYNKQKFYYVIIRIPFALMQGIFALIYVSFFWDFLGMNQTLFVFGMVVYGVFNALNDPLLGQWSDRVDVEKWGSRRLIFIKYGGPLWALIFFLMWIPWSLESQIIIFVHFLIMVILFDNMLTMVVIVWDALLPEIAETVQDRNKIYFLSGIVGAIGGIPVFVALMIFNGGLFQFQVFTGVIAIFNAIVFYFAADRLKERDELHQEINQYSLSESFRHCFKSKSFITFTAYRFFRVINDTIIFSFMFVFSLLFIPGFEVFILLIVGLGGIVGQWIYLRLSKKRGMQKLIMRGKTIEIAISVIGFLISLIQGTEFLWFGFFVFKIILGGYNVFINPYLLLVADEDELLFDTRREGMFLGTNAVFNKIAETVAPILGTSVLLFFGYIQNAPQSFSQPESAIIGIKFLLFIVPTFMDLFGILSLYHFPLKGEKLKSLNEQIEKIHREKLIKYKETQ